MGNANSSKRRFAKVDWLDHGLRQLAKAGPAGMTIDALCRTAGKTKGSFYSHFATMGEFTTELARHWQQRHTDSIVVAAQAVDDSNRRQLLDSLALGLDHELEKNIRQYAAVEPGVAEVLAQVDRHRVEFLGKCYLDTGKFDQDDALALARVEYGFFLLYQSGIDWEYEVFADSYQRFLRIVGAE